MRSCRRGGLAVAAVLVLLLATPCATGRRRRRYIDSKFDAAAAAAAALQRGIALGTRGAAAEALGSFDACLAIDPLSWRAHSNRAWALRQLGATTPEVLACYDAALSADPGRTAFHANAGDRGTLLIELGRTAEALDGFEAVRATDPSNVYNHGDIGRALAVLGRHAESRRTLATWMDLHGLPELSEAEAETIPLPPAVGAADDVSGWRVLGLALAPAGHGDSSGDERRRRAAVPAPGGVGAPGAAPGARFFRFAAGYSLPNSGASTVSAELMRLFAVHQMSSEWQHTLSPEMHLRRGVLNIVVVKDPYFWAASMRRIPHQSGIDSSDLSAPILYQGRTLRGIAHFWNAHMEVYSHRFSAANTLVFRSRDLLFRWPEVVATLRQALRARPGADFSEVARVQDAATAEDSRSRGLAEARAFYAEPRNRVKGFSRAELRYMAATLDPVLMARWGYRHPGAESRGTTDPTNS